MRAIDWIVSACDFCQRKTFARKPNINSSQIVSNKVAAYNTFYLFVRLQITYHTIQSICIQWTKIRARTRNRRATTTTTKKHLQFIM